jgi:hypothetical protein
MRLRLLVLALLVPSLAFGDWYTQSTPTPLKADKKPIPPGANAANFIRGSDWNDYVKAPTEQLRTKVKGLESSVSNIVLGNPNANDVSVTAAGSTTARSLAARAADVVRVRDFTGADPTGVTDSTAAVQAAINAASLTGAAVDLGGRNYAVSSVTMSSGTMRNGTLTQKFTPRGSATLIVSSSGGATVERIRVVQDASVAVGLINRGIHVLNSTDVAIRDSEVRDFNQQGIRLEGLTTARIVVEGNRLTNCNRDSHDTEGDGSDDYGAIAVFAGVSDSTIRGNVVSQGGTGVSLYSEGANSHDLVIAGNRLDGDDTNVSGMGIYVLGNHAGLTISQNQITGYYNEGVVLINGGSYVMSRVAITGNTIRGCKYAAVAVTGTSATATFSTLSITGNAIVGASSSGTGGHGLILQVGYSPPAGDPQLLNIYDLTISGNSITTAITDHIAYGILLNKVRNSVVSGNTISGTWDDALRDANSKNVSYQGNTITVATGKRGITVFPYDDDGSSGPNVEETQNVYSNNIVRGTLTTDVLFGRGPGAAGHLNRLVLTGNRFQTGSFNADFIKNSVISGNLLHDMGTVTVNDTGACIIAGNKGLLDSIAGTTKTSPGAVNRWMQVRDNGALYYVPMYTSTTD